MPSYENDHAAGGSWLSPLNIVIFLKKNVLQSCLSEPTHYIPSDPRGWGRAEV